MATKSKKEFRVFFSWQSDSPKKTNSNAIRDALKCAATSLKSVYPDLTIVIDEATRDTSGSPNIATKILKKINEADMLVCDITTIDPKAKRRCPNPNVTYELGFATALLGEDRIVMLFNTAIGSFPGDLPFDFVQNRASPYKMSEPVSADARKNLASLMTTAIRAVITLNPKTPTQLRGLSPEKIEHAHDVANMKWLMSNLHIPTVDELIKGLPKHLTTKSLWFWEGFNEVASSSRFSLYDSVLRDSVKKFHGAWQTALGFDQHYHDTPDRRLYVFTNLGDLSLSPSKQKAWKAIETARREMAEALPGILSRLRDDYKEVRVDNLSDKAWKKYRADMRSMAPGETIAHTTPKLSKSAGKKKQKKS